MLKKLLSLFILISGISGNAYCQFQVGNVTVTPSTLAANLTVPWELVWGPDNFIWMTERNGRISRVNPANGQVTPLLTLPDVQQNGESGLLGLALHPAFSQNPHLFVAYTYSKNGASTEKLVRYTYTGTSLTSPQVLLDNIPGATFHVGSRLLILPDQTLLMTTGDAGNTSLSQNVSSLAGKVLRLNLDGSVPADNPIPGSYVYSYGHRNAQGLVLGANGLVYSSEHGPGSNDELNIIEPGRNYGWPAVEGFCNTTAEQTFCAANNVKEPIAAWTPTLAVAGIAFYEHPAIPAWQNSVLMTTLKASQLVQIKLNSAGTAVASETIFLNGTYGRLRSICVSPSGKVYIGTSNRDGRATPAANDDRIIVLENLAFTPTGLSGNTMEANGFTVLPGAGRGQFRLKFAPAFRKEPVAVYNLAGKKIFETAEPKNLEMDLNLTRQPAGIYLIRSGKISKKVIVQ